MSQTREERIYKHYRTLIRRYGSRGDADDLTKEERAVVINHNVWLPMAHTWKMPVRSIKNLLIEYRADKS